MIFYVILLPLILRTVDCWLIDLMGFLNSSVYEPLKVWGLENLEMVFFPGLSILEILEGCYPLGSCILRGGGWVGDVMKHLDP